MKKIAGPTLRVAAALLALMLSLLQLRCAPKAAELRGDLSRAIRLGMAQGKGKFDHAGFDEILRRHVNLEKRQFDYEGLKSHEQDLNAYLVELAEAEPENLSRDELLALFINAYNAYTVHSILKTITTDRPRGVASIRDIPGVFSTGAHVVAGTKLSLDNIEHNILRPVFKDPRIHFAVNCASVGCPPLADEAYTGDRIDRQLEAAAERTLRSPDYVRAEGDRLLVTRLLDWYGGDFVAPGYVGSKRSLVEYIRGYTRDEVRRFLDERSGKVGIEFMSYDWALNRAD